MSTKDKTQEEKGETVVNPGEATDSSAQIEALKAQLKAAEARNAELMEIVNQQSVVIKQNMETFDKIKASTASQTISGQNAMKNYELMCEKTKVFYPPNPFDPNKTHVTVLNPVTGNVDKVKVGEWVEVNRAVAEILEHSAKADKLTLMLEQKKVSEFEQKTANLDKE